MDQAAQAVIVEAVRTPIGRGHREKGYYKDTHPAELLAACFRAIFERTGVDPNEVDDVFSGCVMQYGEQTYNIARTGWLMADLPYTVPATTIDRQCGSAQQAVNFAAGMIAAGVYDVVLAAGVEHMGHNPLTDPFDNPAGIAWPPELREKANIELQTVGAELLADEWSVSRRDMDEFSVLSQQRAATATEQGRFDREIVPIVANGSTITKDQGIRPDTSYEGLSGLKPAFDPDGRLTAGNSSQISDGAAAVLVMSQAKADELGVRGRAKIIAQNAVGVSPRSMLTGPMPSTKKLLEKTGMTIGDIDLYEINEAFAAVPVAWLREFGADHDKLNVNGGAVALGHPVGCTGARLFATILHELERTDTETGLISMCCGGGLGTGTVIQRI